MPVGCREQEKIWGDDHEKGGWREGERMKRERFMVNVEYIDILVISTRNFKQGYNWGDPAKYFIQT